MRVVLLGANGMFGKRLAMLLAALPGAQLVLAGRDARALQALRARLQPAPGNAIEALVVDLDGEHAANIITAACPDVLIDTCGPFQQRDYRWPRLAIGTGFHYLDLADAPDFVAGIGVLDGAARAAKVLVCSGASTVPALSSAVLDEYCGRFSALEYVEVGISPGNQAERGRATVRSILSNVGKPHAQFIDGQLHMRAGWSQLRRHRYAAPVGTRWLSYCAVPDALVLPARYPGLRSLEFRAGLELHRMHLGTWLGGLLVRAHLLPSLLPLADWARRLSERWIKAGSDRGAMHVRMRGFDQAQRPLDLSWELIAAQGDGTYVPASAAAAIVRLLIEGQLDRRGALPCVGLLNLGDFADTLRGRAVRFHCEDRP